MVSNPLKQEVQSFFATPSWKRLLFSMMQLAWDAPWCTCSLGSLGFFKTVTVGELLVKNIEENKQEMLTSTMEAVQAPKKNQTLQREEIPVVEENSAAIFFGQCCEHNYSIWNMNIYIYEHIKKKTLKTPRSLGLFFLKKLWNLGASLSPYLGSQGAKANVQKAVEEQQQVDANMVQIVVCIWISCVVPAIILCIYYCMQYISTHSFSYILQCSVTSLMWLLAFCTCINETLRKTWKSKGPPKDPTAAVPGQGCRGTKIPVVGGRGPPEPDGQTDDKLLDVGVSYFRTKPGSWTQAGPDMKDPK